jgi:ParB-like chromosome segregation protein Spo0J
MDKAQFDEFVEDIRERGQLVPIWVSGDEVIDGRKRLQACKALGTEPKIIEVPRDSDATAISHALNILRTHYTVGQRALFAAKRATRKAGNLKHNKSIMFDPTLSETAEQAGVSKPSVVLAKRILRDGAPEVVAAVESGTLSLDAANSIVRKVAKREQAAAVDRTLARSNGYRSSPKRSLDGRMQRALDMADNAIELIGQFVLENGARKEITMLSTS